MKAAVFLGEKKIIVKDVEKPKCSREQVLVRVKACAICGSDLRIFRGEKNIKVPITGHEISGIVEEMGEYVKGLSVGDKVIIQTVIGCGECEPCRRGQENRCKKKFKAIGYDYNGGFAQFLLVPKDAVRQGCVIKIPNYLSFDESTLVEPISCVINGWAPFRPRKPGFTTVVIGAGVIGMLHAEYARMKSAKVILVNRTAPRLNLAKEIGLGSDEFVDASRCNIVQRIKELTDDLGADIVICAASSKDVQRDAIEMSAVDADISFFAGISKRDQYNSVNTNLIHYHELHVHGANSSNRRHYLEAVDLVASGKVDVKRFITHKFSLDMIEEAIRTLEDRSKNALKIIVDPWM
jgi:L-iditol 2-dehydrogenase